MRGCTIVILCSFLKGEYSPIIEIYNDSKFPLSLSCVCLGTKAICAGSAVWRSWISCCKESILFFPAIDHACLKHSLAEPRQHCSLCSCRLVSCQNCHGTGNEWQERASCVFFALANIIFINLPLNRGICLVIFSIESVHLSFFFEGKEGKRL